MGWGSVAVSGVIRQVIISDIMGGSWQAQDGGEGAGRRGDVGAGAAEEGRPSRNFAAPKASKTASASHE